MVLFKSAASRLIGGSVCKPSDSNGAAQAAMVTLRVIFAPLVLNDLTTGSIGFPHCKVLAPFRASKITCYKHHASNWYSVISMHLPYMKRVSDGMAVPGLHQAGC